MRYTRSVWSAAVIVAAAAACSTETTAPAPGGAPRLAAGGGGGGNPQFNKNGTSVALVGNTAVVTFKETGLAAGSIQTVQVTGTGTATFECINGGNKNPAAENKRTVSEQLTASDTFKADKSGNITGSLTLQAPGPGDFSCPRGQTLTGPTDVSFSNLVITDLTSGATLSF